MTTFGYVLPASVGADVPDPSDLFAIAEMAESSELGYLWVSDHVVWWHPMHDSLTLLAALAARTSRIRIGPAVLLLALRNPVLVAKALATIGRIAPGRLTLGVGVGGEFPPEWDAAGVPRRGRGTRTEETVFALKGLWSEEAFSMHGKHVRIEGVDLHPKMRPTPPIWIGGRSDAALSRAARMGDGWMGIFVTPEGYRERLTRLERMAAEHGRDPSAITPSLYVWTCVADTTAEARAQAERMLGEFYNLPFEKLERFAVVGDPAGCAERLAAFADAGVRNFAIAPISAVAGTEPLERLVRDVMPLMS